MPMAAEIPTSKTSPLESSIILAGLAASSVFGQSNLQGLCTVQSLSHPRLGNKAFADILGDGIDVSQCHCIPEHQAPSLRA